MKKKTKETMWEQQRERPGLNVASERGVETMLSADTQHVKCVSQEHTKRTPNVSKIIRQGVSQDPIP